LTSLSQQQNEIINNNEYTNPTFLSSSNDLKFPNRSNREKQQQNVWSTTSVYIPSDLVKNKNKDNHRNFTNTINTNSSFPSRAKVTKNKKCKIVCIIATIFIIFCILAAVAFSLAYFYYWKPREQQQLKQCNEECVANKYCVMKTKKI
jgi:hypothetical protein